MSAISSLLQFRISIHAVVMILSGHANRSYSATPCAATDACEPSMLHPGDRDGRLLITLVVRIEDLSNLAHLRRRIRRHEDIAASCEPTSAAVHNVRDEGAELAVRNLASAGSKYRNRTRIDNALHRRDRAIERQLDDICAEVDGKRTRVKQRLQWRMVLDAGAARIDHRQQRNTGALARNPPPPPSLRSCRSSVAEPILTWTLTASAPLRRQSSTSPT